MPFLLSKDIGDIAKDIGGDSRVQNFKMQISHELQRISTKGIQFWYRDRKTIPLVTFNCSPEIGKGSDYRYDFQLDGART